MTSSSAAVSLQDALLLHRQGALDEAVRCYDRLLQNDPTNADARYYLAMAWCQKGLFGQAIDTVRRALATDPQSARLHNLLGMALNRLGQPQQALASFADAIATQSDFADAHGNSGDVLMQLGKVAEAVISYERATALRPDSIHDLLNLGAALLQLGRYEQAMKACDKVLLLQSDCADAHFNRGCVLLKLGRPEQALASFDAVLAVTPQDLRALINRGIALRDLKRHDEAVAAYNRALVLNPDSTEALYQLGNLFAAQDKSADAVVQFERALLVKPDHVGALERLVSVLLGQNEYPRALGAVMRVLKFAETAAAKGLFVLCIRGRPLTSDDGNIRALVLRALTEPWDRPADVSTAATSLVKLNPIIRASCAWPANAGSKPVPVEALSGDLAAIADDSLLRSLIETVPVYDIELERFLTKLRSVLLEVAVASVGTTVDDRLLRACCALARQCFINEYAFDESAAETGRVRSLCARLLSAAQRGDSIPALWVAAAAAYMPLHSLPVADALMEKTWPQTVVELLAQQIGEPREEQRLRQSIPRLTAIADDVSIKVKQQYEENPYPRWIKPAPAREAMSVADYFSSPFGLSGAGSQRDTVDILVAGCGTGQRLVETARQFKGAQVLAIDLSLASLAYARRQVEALGLDNVEFAEADILNMGTMDRTFDIVDASGVLHHLSDPWAGWRALLARLRAGGFIEVCLYSALARRDINAARAFVAERGYRPSAPDIRRCRQDILASGTAWAKSVANYRDFFATSECRDLLFHVQEHQMALPQIAAFLAESNADFIGFNIDPRVLAQFKARFPAERAVNDLGLWHLFETENPDTFIEMYCLWMRKRA
jgi:tetratricopeptide (TPR) repeat protein/SAM-dependent methyltransferase